MNNLKINAFVLGFLLSAMSLQTALASPNPRINTVIEQIEFREVTVGDALKILADQSDLNIVASKQAAEIPVTMYLRRVTALQVIDALAKTYNLWYQRDAASNIVRIYTVKEYRMEQVEYKKEETEVFTMKNAKNALDLAETIQNLFSGRVMIGYGRNQTEIIRDLSQRFQRFSMIDGRSTLSSGRGGGGGGGGGNMMGGNSMGGNMMGGNSMGGNRGRNSNQGLGGQFGRQRKAELDETLRSTADVLEKMEGEGDAKGLSHLLLGDAAANRDLLDAAIRHQAPIYVGVIKHQNRVLVRSRDKDAMDEIRRLYKQLDTDSSMLLMEVKVLSIDLSDGYNSLFDFKVKSNNTNIGTNNGAQSFSADEALDTGLRTAAAVFDPSLLATVVSNNFEARLQLLEKENRVTELATPMLLTTNQEVSRVFVGEERPIISGYSASATTASTGSLAGTVVSTPILVPETDVRAIGTTLLLTPNINADRTVSIQLLVEQSTLSAGQGTIPVQIGSTLQDANIDLVQERTFSGTVVAKDSTAVAVGGLIEEAAGNREKKVPILGDIPLLGFFFREDAQSRARKELVIIIKPHIMETPADAESTSRAMLEDTSVHPNALDAGNLDIYSNPDKRHKGYVLEKPYKEYPKQDAFDKFRGRGDSGEFSKKNRTPQMVGAEQAEAISAKQQVYVDLTRFASETIRMDGGERKVDPKISDVPIRQFERADLTYDSRIWAMPLAAWRQGGVHVTAIELHNLSDDTVDVDYRHLKGQWLASTVENDVLERQGAPNSATYLYLISAQPFDDVMALNKR